MLNKNKAFFIILLLLFISMLIPEIAHAADLFDIPTGDKSKEMFMDKLFDSTSVSTLEASPLNAIISVFNTCVLMLGGILAAYTLITGTMSTAHEGEMLGKKWSAMWLPIRTTISAAFIFPTMGGFCIAQVIVIWLIHQGIGLADTLWSSYVKSMPTSNRTTALPPNRSEVFSLATGMLKANYCSIVLDDYFTKLQAQSSTYKSSSYHPTTSFYKADTVMSNIADSTFKNTTYYYGYNAKTMNADKYELMGVTARYTTMADDICGKVQLDSSKSSGSSGSFSLTSLSNITNSANNAKNNAVVSSASQNAGGSVNSDPTIQEVNVRKMALVQTMQDELLPVAQKYFSMSSDDKVNATGELYQALNKATSNYMNTSKTIASDMINKSPQTWDGIISTMTQDGWMYAGSWYMQIYRIQTLLSNVSRIVPTYTYNGQMTQATQLGDSSKVSGPYTQFETVLANISDGVSDGTSKEILAKDYKENNSTENLEFHWTDLNPTKLMFKSLITGLNSLVSDGVMSALDSSGDSASSDPIGFAYNLGNAIEDAVWLMGAAVFIASVPVSAIATTIGTFLSPVISMLFLASNMLTVVLPFMPFFLWLGAVLGWAILCIEAVIAAPLWMMIHMHPDGDGVIGRGGAGYGMVLSLTVRPALMIIGLACAIICIQIFAAMVNDMFMIAFYSTVSRNGISLLQVPIILGTYAMSLFIVMKKSFSLIHIIPDEILKWLGVNNHNSTEKSASMGLQTMMAAKQFDDKMGQLSPGNAMRAGQDTKRAINEKKDVAEKNNAAAAIAQDSDSLNNFTKNTAGSGSNGESISSQNKTADATINRFSTTPPSAMSPEDTKSLKAAYQTKADNLNSVLQGNVLTPGSAAYEKIEEERDSAVAGLKSIEGVSNSSANSSPKSSNEDSGGQDTPRGGKSSPSKADNDVIGGDK